MESVEQQEQQDVVVVEYEDPFPSAQEMIFDEQPPGEEDVPPAEVTLPDTTKKRKRTGRKRKLGEGREKAHVCFLCDKDYMYKGHLRRHIATEHHICRPVSQEKCEFCGAVFSSATFEEHKVTSDREVKLFMEKYEISEEKQKDLMEVWSKYKESTLLRDV